MLSGNIKRLLFIAFMIFAQCAMAQQKDISVHDPVMIKEGDTYYLFCTGWGISVFSSPDLVSWKKEKRVFEKAPEWTTSAVEGFRGHMWAPDISYSEGKYYLYYSVSSFGKNTSAIGVATNTTLNSENEKYEWVDHGLVVQSVPERDMWNAIDPNLIVGESGDAWLAFGSFWDGLKLVKLADDRLSVAKPEEWRSIARRERSFNLHDKNPGDGAIEAPFIFKKDGYYYLFASWDYCCRGAESTYKVVVGRSENASGPYLDKEGVRMDQGGGSLVVEGNEKWAGVGHNSAYTFDGTDYLIFHGYDMEEDGHPKLIVKEIEWDEDQWPSVSLE